jgi:lipopolysaccharide export system permease protein
LFAPHARQIETGTSRRMKVVEQYILRRTLGIFVATLFWVLAIVWTTQILTRINVVTGNGQSAATFFEIAWLVLPAVIPVVIPLRWALRSRRP